MITDGWFNDGAVCQHNMETVYKFMCSVYTYYYYYHRNHAKISEQNYSSLTDIMKGRKEQQILVMA